MIKRPQLITIGIIEDDLEVVGYLTRAFGDNESARHQIKFRVLSTDDYRLAESWAEDDIVDIYFVDLGLPDISKGAEPNWQVGRNLVRFIHGKSTAGIIVYTSEHLGALASELLAIGADDFVRKSEVLGEFGDSIQDMQSYLRTKAVSVWRRAQYCRPAFRTLSNYSDKRFQIGKWQFEIGSRSIEDGNGGCRLTANEHAVLRHLCVSEDNSIGALEFLTFITGQRSETEDVRLKNLIYRLRQKLGPTVELIHSDAKYRLLSVAELPNTKPADHF